MNGIIQIMGKRNLIKIISLVTKFLLLLKSKDEKPGNDRAGLDHVTSSKLTILRFNAVNLNFTTI